MTPWHASKEGKHMLIVMIKKKKKKSGKGAQRHCCAKEAVDLIIFPSCFFPLPSTEPGFNSLNFIIYLKI